MHRHMHTGNYNQSPLFLLVFEMHVFQTIGYQAKKICSTTTSPLLLLLVVVVVLTSEIIYFFLHRGIGGGSRLSDEWCVSVKGGKSENALFVLSCDGLAIVLSYLVIGLPCLVIVVLVSSIVLWSFVRCLLLSLFLLLASPSPPSLPLFFFPKVRSLGKFVLCCLFPLLFSIFSSLLFSSLS